MICEFWEGGLLSNFQRRVKSKFDAVGVVRDGISPDDGLLERAVLGIRKTAEHSAIIFLAVCG
jgi:hypothetical protein